MLINARVATIGLLSDLPVEPEAQGAAVDAGAEEEVLAVGRPGGAVVGGEPVADYAPAFDIMRSGKSGKVILDWADAA